jgi:hypothetical protein
MIKTIRSSIILASPHSVYVARTTQESCEMNELEAKRMELERELAELNKDFEREMLSRGFDPEQVDNVPLNNELTKLHLRRLELMEQLAQISEMEGRKI